MLLHFHSGCSDVFSGAWEEEGITTRLPDTAATATDARQATSANIVLHVIFPSLFVSLFVVDCVAVAWSVVGQGQGGVRLVGMPGLVDPHNLVSFYFHILDS